MSAAAASPKKAKAKAVKKPAEHPKYHDMVVAAIVALKERGGSSRAAILKHVKANNKVGDNAKIFVNQALKKGIVSKKLKFAAKEGRKGAGSYKVGEVAKVVKKKKAAKKVVKKKKPAKKVKKAKKPAAKKAKKPAAKKAKKAPAKKAAAKKPAAKKAVKKAAPAKKAAKKPAKKAAAKKKPAAKK